MKISGKFDRMLVVCNLSSQPRIHKRVLAIHSLVNTKVFGFRRKIYEGNEFSSDIDYQSLGYIENGNYLIRIRNLICAWWIIVKARKKGDAFYAFGLDCFAIAKLSGMKNGYVEYGDIRNVKKPNSVLAKLERLLLRSAQRIIITSPSFYEDYFKKYGFKRQQFTIIENKMSKYVDSRPIGVYSRCNDRKIRIGLIGLFRYIDQIEFILRFVTENSDKYTLECYGTGPAVDLIKDSLSASISYHGEFKCPEDLSKIYKSIDASYVAYDSKDANVKIALPNKLYESIYFATPLICSEGTVLQEKVLNLNVGVAVNTLNYDIFSNSMKNINRPLINNLANNCFSIDGKSLVDESEQILGSMFVYE